MNSKKKRKLPSRGKFLPKNPDKYAGDHTKITYRSSWELKLMIVLDNNPNILKWNSEEVIIPYHSEIDNKMHRYYPDFLVLLKTKSNRKKRLLIEVKPHHESVQPNKAKFKSEKAFIRAHLTYKRNMEKWEAASLWCESNKTEFKVLTEKNTNFM